MADNHSTPSVVAPIAPALRRPSLRLAVVAAATGALVAGSVQVGAATASAAALRPSPDGTIALQLPAGQFLPGIAIPAAAEASPPGWMPASAANWITAPTLLAPAPAPEPQAAPMPAPMPDPVLTPAPVPEPVPAPMPEPVLPPPPPAVVQPVAGFLTSSYGPRWGTHHNGIDIGANLGTPIFSAAGGVVINAGAASGFGQWVRVQHDDGTITVYGHVDTYLVSVGERVATGQQIATVGNRGQSTGPHLHFEAWAPGGSQVDPLIWLRDSGVVVTW